MTTPSPGTIDITDLVESLRSAWVDWGTAFVFGAEAAIPGMSWVALPVVSDIDREVIHLILDALSKAAEMLVFFENTAIRKAAQAQDFVDAVAAKRALPPTATQEEYKIKEQAQMIAFRNFVMVTN